jgi:hypothetical protein
MPAHAASHATAGSVGLHGLAETCDKLRSSLHASDMRSAISVIAIRTVATRL